MIGLYHNQKRTEYVMNLQDRDALLVRTNERESCKMGKEKLFVISQVDGYGFDTMGIAFKNAGEAQKFQKMIVGSEVSEVEIFEDAESAIEFHVKRSNCVNSLSREYLRSHLPKKSR